MNATNPWIDARIRQVRTADAEAYLVRHGWTRRPFNRPQMLLYEGPLADDGKPLVQAVPAGEPDGEYIQCMLELISSLAVIEARPALDVLTDMLPEAAVTSSNAVNGAGTSRAAVPASRAHSAK